MKLNIFTVIIALLLPSIVFVTASCSSDLSVIQNRTTNTTLNTNTVINKEAANKDTANKIAVNNVVANKEPANNPGKLAPIPKRVELAARTWWDSAATKCGDYHYMDWEWPEVPRENPAGDLVMRKALFQLKGGNYVVEDAGIPIPEGEKNRLGLEWWGEVRTTAEAHRRYDETTKKWSDWSDGVPTNIQGKSMKEHVTLRANFQIRRGETYVNNNSFKPAKKFQCAQVPK